MPRRNAYIFAPERKRRKNSGCLILILSIVLALLTISLLSNQAMNKRIELSTVKISVMSLDKAFESFTVLHISDLQASSIGTEAALWRALLFGKRYHAVVLTGDMVGRSGDSASLLALIEILQNINSEAPIYFIEGDDDPDPLVYSYRGTPEVYADWVIEAKNAGAIYLDAPVGQQVGRNTAWFVPGYLYFNGMDAEAMRTSLIYQKEDMEKQGTQYEAEGGAKYRALLARLEAMERAVSALTSMSPNDLQIAVTHVPWNVEIIRNEVEWADQSKLMTIRRVGLVMTGHYTGGQWRLPGVGAIYVPELGWFPGDGSILGLQRLNSVNQYINGGLGASSYYPMPGRLFNMPSAVLLTFTARIE